jgi:hypothetical protein
MKPNLHQLVLAIVVGGAIACILASDPRSPFIWVGYQPSTVIWPALGALIVAGLWTLPKA